jgi:hypothetical protein
VEINLHLFLNLALHGGEWCIGVLEIKLHWHLHGGEWLLSSLVPFCMRWGAPKAGLDMKAKKKFLSLSGIERVVQLEACPQ